jgi:hypothetical protein
MRKVTLFMLALVIAAGAVWAQRIRTVPKLNTTQKLRMPRNAACTSLATPQQEGDLCWDSDDDALYVYDGSTWTAVSTPSGSFAATSNQTFTDTITFDSAGTVNLDGANFYGPGTSGDVTLWTLDLDTDRLLFWDDDYDGTDATDGFEFDFDATQGDGLDTVIIEDGITIEDKVIVEGATANAFETTITFTDPTADNAITVADTGGTLLITGTGGLKCTGFLASAVYDPDETANEFVSFNHANAAASATETDEDDFIVPAALNFHTLRAEVTTDPTASGTWVIQLRADEADVTNIDCSIANGATTCVSDETAAVAVAAGSKINLDVSRTVGNPAGSSEMLVSVCYNP